MRVNFNDISEARNEEVRRKVSVLFNDFGVSRKFFAKCAGLDYGMFTKWLSHKKQYHHINLDKIEETLQGKYGQFKDEE